MWVGLHQTNLLAPMAVVVGDALLLLLQQSAELELGR